MASSIDQRATKGQANHVPNGQPKEDDYASYMQQQQQQQQGAYAADMSGANMAADPYVSSYYPPYVHFHGQAPGGNVYRDPNPLWSTRDTMYNNYGPFDFNMFSRGAGYEYSQAGWFPGAADYSWGAGMQMQPAVAGAHKNARDFAMDGYYGKMADGSGAPVDMSGTMMDGSGMQAVEQGLRGVSLSSASAAAEDGYEVRADGRGGASAGSQRGSGQGGSTKKSWANIASQPARAPPTVTPMIKPSKGGAAASRAPLPASTKHETSSGGFVENKNNNAGKPWSGSRGGTATAVSGPYGSSATRTGASGMTSSSGGANSAGSSAAGTGPAGTGTTTAPAADPVVDSLRSTHKYNPKEFDLTAKGARFFIIKSFSEDDVHRSIKYSIWCSTDYGNKRLDAAWHERDGKGSIYLLFSVNGSGHFCGMAQMTSPVDYHASSGVWAQDKWKGQFEVTWIYIKDVPNSQLRHIKLENNENKPVTNSRDTQEVPPEKGRQVLRIIHQYRHTTSIFDDFSHYEKKQEEIASNKKPEQRRD